MRGEGVIELLVQVIWDFFILFGAYFFCIFGLRIWIREQLFFQRVVLRERGCEWRGRSFNICIVLRVGSLRSIEVRKMGLERRVCLGYFYRFGLSWGRLCGVLVDDRCQVIFFGKEVRMRLFYFFLRVLFSQIVCQLQCISICEYGGGGRESFEIKTIGGEEVRVEMLRKRR